MPLPPEPALRRFLTAGLQAPSAENKHYLRFRATPDGVELLATDTASWADRPHRRLLALLAYGAVVENIALRSVQDGWGLDCGWAAEPGREGVIATLGWHRADVEVDELAAAIEARHTNRRFYRRGPLPADSLSRLDDAAATVPGCRLRWLDGQPARASALRALRLAETERFRRPALHEELFGAVRFDIGWRQSTQEWLPPGALEVEPPARAAFAALRRWPVMRAATYLGAHWALGVRAAWVPCALAPHLGLVLADGPPTLRELNAGRALQRVWLAATALGLAFQPFAAPTALACQRAGNGWVSSEVRTELLRLLDLLADGADAKPSIFFRLGRAAPPSVVTQRQALPIDVLSLPGTN